MHLAMRSAGMSKRICVLDRGETRENEAEFEILMTTISIAVAEVLGRLDDRLQLASCEWLFRYRLVHCCVASFDGFSLNSWALHEGGVAGVVEGLALRSGAFPLWSASDWRRGGVRRGRGQSEIRTSEQKWRSSEQTREISCMQRQQTID